LKQVGLLVAWEQSLNALGDGVAPLEETVPEHGLDGGVSVRLGGDFSPKLSNISIMIHEKYK
jgi:hypothetical protein